MKDILKRYNIRPSKKLGQNFLIDKGVLRKIIDAAELHPNDIVLEIGPGLGILTIELAKRTKKVIAVEKDMVIAQVLEKILKENKINNVKVVNKDILQISNQIQNLNYKLVANLPYYITSPVIRKFLETKDQPKLMILMVQKEVAQRICAAPPKMSLLSVAVQFYAKPEIISYVSKKSFTPSPKVDSAIIKIKPQPIPKINTKKFFNLVKNGFSSKRKMLKNNLGIKESILKDLGLNPKTRAENLSIQDWLKLFHKLDLG
jgi:16S rRNA (adenine1518-N6/adenine1519-N6)-dimethyltransferase